MGITLPEDLKSLIDQPVFVSVATVGADGSPHNTAMWVSREGDRILLNTAAGRVKWRNLSRDPRLSISLSPADRPYVNYSISGRVVEMRTSDGDRVIDGLALKYLGKERYPFRAPGEVRVTIVVEALHIAGGG
jgi:PPOX class probable F420-dependent enzyme